MLSNSERALPTSDLDTASARHRAGGMGLGTGLRMVVQEEVVFIEEQPACGHFAADTFRAASVTLYYDGIRIKICGAESLIGALMIIVDRIEGDIAILEVEGNRIDFPLAALPEGTKEGDGLAFTKIAAPSGEAEARIERLKKSAKQGPGDFEL